MTTLFQARFGERHRPLALALCISALSVGSLALPSTVSAQETSGAPDAVTQTQVRDFQIPAQPLTRALIRFATQADLQLVYDASTFEGLSTAGLRGSYPIGAGLDRLLAGTGVNYRITANNYIELTREPVSSDSRREAPKRLKSVVVSAAGFEQDIVEAPASISVISREELEGKSYTDLTDALQDIPGLSIEGGPGRKGGTGEISIRGLDSKYTLIMVDGKAQGSRQAYYNGFGGGAEFGWLPPMSAIERIEIIRGPMSSLYGSDALGGVVNVITKKVVNEWSGTVTADKTIQDDSNSGDSDQYRYYLSGALVKDRLGLAVYGNTHNREEDAIVNGYRQMRKDSNTAKLSWQATEAQSLQLEAGFARQRAVGTADRSGELELENERSHYALTHDIHWNGNIQTHSYLQDEDMKNITQNARYGRTTLNTSTVMALGDHMLTVGGQYREQKTENPERAKNKATLERWDSAVFVEDEWSLTDKLALTGGARWVNDEKYGDEITPRLYGIYRVTSQWTFKAGVSTGYSTPDLKQGDSQWVEGGGGRSTDGADVGNDDLKPEESVSYESALLWNSDAGAHASITVYQTDFKDKIEKPVICQESEPLAYDCSYLGVPYQRVYQYQNVEDAELRGVEAAITIPFGSVDATANYTYSDSEQKTGENAGEPLNNQPEHRVNLKADWRVSEQFKVWSRVKYKSSTAQTGTSEIPAYTFVDAGLTYHFSKAANVYMGVYNLFDKRVTQEDFGKVLDGRYMNVGLTVNF
ncbi:TonB-dependent receptor domain-containing protein [Marinimicrobium sp. ARAG 43.8]|uniref:TonB-dependent receptor n=1 Tax=Marinimicrobium sp. ARAG 43.8 TaxID=3418719 RepID=UPI003CF682B4